MEEAKTPGELGFTCILISGMLVVDKGTIFTQALVFFCKWDS